MKSTNLAVSENPKACKPQTVDSSKTATIQKCTFNIIVIVATVKIKNLLIVCVR